MSPKKNTTGFSLIELLIVITIMGIMFGLSIPSYQRYLASASLKGARSEIASEIQQLRARAMATHVAQTIHFALDSTGAGDFHVHNGVVSASWDLPLGITYAGGSSAGLTLNTDGRASTSTYIILCDSRGQRDTVSVQLSGLVLVR